MAKVKMLKIKKQAGVTLIEVLVTLVIMSVALTGIAAVQATSMQSASQIKFRSAAVASAQSMLDAMRSNRGELNLYAGSNTSKPASDTQAGRDYAAFDETLEATLDNRNPGFTITISGDRLATVTVSWDQRKEEGSGTDTKTYSVSAYL